MDRGIGSVSSRHTLRALAGAVASWTVIMAVLWAGLWAVGGARAASAQPHPQGVKVEIAWNRYYSFVEIEGHLRALASAYPELIELRSIGKSREGRDMWLAIVTSPDVRKGTEAHRERPAMWIDGNIHANEIQAAEVVLYSIWYLATRYGQNQDITELMDRTTFYMMPVVNPDSRQAWFDEPATPSSPRGNRRPVDDDNDGLVDEDPADDLDGDGSITSMWRPDPSGDWIRDEVDPRVFRQAREGERGEWSRAGSEGIDNDGDGRINEDAEGGDDMNRNWPGDWQPDYIQGGAGAYPFSNPETRAIGEFLYSHPNVAAFQSYHNSGGMILRGPGTSYREDQYPRADQQVLQAIAAAGEELLPFYRSLVIYRDLYNVHGGEATWASEGLGIIAYTNELFNAGKYFQREGYLRPSEAQMTIFRDRLQFGETFKDYTEIDHPQLGRVLVGGTNKWASRSTPTFMLEEECHRNFAFTMFHAGEMAELSFERIEAEPVSPGLWAVSVEVRNSRLIPTRTGRAADRAIGADDLLTCEPAAGRVLTSGRIGNFWDDALAEETRHEPGRVRLRAGVPSRGVVRHRFYIEAPPGTEVRLGYVAEKAVDIRATVTLTP